MIDKLLLRLIKFWLITTAFALITEARQTRQKKKKKRATVQERLPLIKYVFYSSSNMSLSIYTVERRLVLLKFCAVLLTWHEEQGSHRRRLPVRLQSLFHSTLIRREDKQQMTPRDDRFTSNIKSWGALRCRKSPTRDRQVVVTEHDSQWNGKKKCCWRSAHPRIPNNQRKMKRK